MTVLLATLALIGGGTPAVEARRADQTVRATREERREARENRRRRAERRRRRATRREWAREVRAYGVGLLRARMRCESGNVGGYRLRTTGNGYWFAHQFTVGAWTGAGGRVGRSGNPRGWWRRMPGRLEQDYRAVVWDRIHGGDPWPNCP